MSKTYYFNNISKIAKRWRLGRSPSSVPLNLWC